MHKSKPDPHGALLVAKGTNGAGSYNWLIPATQALGSDYTIRITSTSNSSYKDISDGNFSITN
jgi:hypothetical protein